VTKNARSQLMQEERAAAVPLMPGGKISPTISHGTGPAPMENEMKYMQTISIGNQPNPSTLAASSSLNTPKIIKYLTRLKEKTLEIYQSLLYNDIGFG
jgi:hypothetical protein